MFVFMITTTSNSWPFYSFLKSECKPFRLFHYQICVTHPSKQADVSDVTLQLGNLLQSVYKLSLIHISLCIDNNERRRLVFSNFSVRHFHRLFPSGLNRSCIFMPLSYSYSPLGGIINCVFKQWQSIDCSNRHLRNLTGPSCG